MNKTQGTALATIMTLFNECLNLYVESMNKSIEHRSVNEDEPYFNEAELKAIHENAKAEFLSEVTWVWCSDLFIIRNRINFTAFFSQFQKTPQLGDDEIVQPFRNKLANDIEIKFRSFKQENEGRRSNFIVST